MFQVEVCNQLCLIRYEDESVYWTHFKDIHKQLSSSTMSDSDILCTECKDGTSNPPNEIVICDVCNQGYHQNCHKPIVDDSILGTDDDWTCRVCLYALGTKEGGAMKDSKIGKALRLTKTVLAYDINLLNWNDNHQINHENIYCYCGGPGKYYSKMLQCSICSQWFHEACIQELDAPVLEGDCYFKFYCGVCKNGKEQVIKMVMNWSDMIALVLNNLTISQSKQFFDLHQEIIPFIRKNAASLKVNQDLKTLSREELIEKVADTLPKYKKKFICGREVRKKSSLWALRISYPFVKPLVFLPKTFKASNAKPSSKLSSAVSSESSLKPNSSPLFPLIPGACRKGPSIYPKHAPKRCSIRKKESNVEKKSTINRPTPSKSITSSSISKIKSNQKRAECKIKQRQAAFSSKQSNASNLQKSGLEVFVSLDRAIPKLDNFEGQNNPFFDLSEKSLTSSQCLEEDYKDIDSREDYQIISNSNSSKLTLRRITSKGIIKNGSHNLLTSSSDHYINDLASQDQKARKCVIKAQRLTSDGKLEYLFEWE